MRQAQGENCRQNAWSILGRYNRDAPPPALGQAGEVAILLSSIRVVDPRTRKNRTNPQAAQRTLRDQDVVVVVCVPGGLMACRFNE